MKQVLLASVAWLTLTNAGQTADQALIIGNGEYSALRDVRGGADVTGASDELRAAGFDLVVGRDATSASLLASLERFVAQSQNAERLLVVLSGRFMHTAQDSWFLPVDSEGTPQLARLNREGISLSLIMTVLAAHPGQAMLLLGSDEGVTVSASPFLSRGIGALNVAQGVTVFTGDPRAIAEFTENVLPLPAMSLTVRAAQRQGLAGYGYLPPDFRFLPESVGIAQPGPADVLQNGLDENAAWEQARRLDTIAAYRNYLAQFTDGPHRAEATGLIREIQTEPNRASRLAEQALQLGREQRREIQRNLSILDFDPRGIDGLFGPGSRAAISGWQKSNRYDATGYLTLPQINRLAAQAETRAAELEAQAEQRRLEQEEQDRDYWQATGAAGDEAGLRAYLKRYPDGIFAEVAQGRLDVFEERNRSEAATQDRIAWDAANKIGTEPAYRDYLRSFPDGAFAEEALARIDEVTKDDANAREIEAARNAEARLGLNTTTRRLIENRLAALGLKPGTVDGEFDEKTRRAIRRYQQARELPVSGYLNQQTVVRLLADSILR